MLENSDELNLILPKFSHHLYLLFSHKPFWNIYKEILLDQNSQWFFILVFQFFTAKHYRSRCRSRWENLNRFQYRFQPIKFVNLVVPSPCEMEPYYKGNWLSYHSSFLGGAIYYAVQVANVYKWLTFWVCKWSITSCGNSSGL